jgi:hypothetical protein
VPDQTGRIAVSKGGKARGICFRHVSGGLAVISSGCMAELPIVIG